ncbi:MAG TPA: endolytic transglycosylase MltG [Patescibacteria group bacterium]
MAKKIIIILAVITVLLGGLFYSRYQVYYSRGDFRDNKIFEITKGEGNAQISARLKGEGLISGQSYFYYYLRSHGLLNKILPGKYELNGNMAIPEIALRLTQEENILPGYVKITFPEGWNSKQMAERLTANGLPGDEFLKIAQNVPASFREKYAFSGNAKSLEGYLFPDTYFFAKDIGAEGIVQKMLDNFDQKLNVETREAIKNQSKSISDIITMASIVEMEVKTPEDRALVSGIYWSRIKIGQSLQSDITLAYILGEKKKQYSFADTRTASPYNTYLNIGLPPGPIDNPGFDAIQAAVYPKNSDYNYYLSDPETGNTIFSRTFAEHNDNKVKYGL